MQLNLDLLPGLIEYVQQPFSRASLPGNIVSQESYADSYSFFDLESLRAVGNNLTYTVSGNLHMDFLTEDVQVELLPPPSNKLSKVIFEGQFLIGVEEGKEKIMVIYKCYRDLIFSFGEPKDGKAQLKQAIYACRKVTQITVNSPVKLTEAFELTSFLVVRFRSENSVVYYKIDKVEFSFVEVNLKGYDPTNVFMVESNCNTIVICHFKSSAVQPYMLFALVGENLRRIQIPNIGQLIQPDINARFISGSLEYEGGIIFLYVGMRYPASISFLKYKIDINDNTAKLHKSAYNLPLSNSLDPQSGSMCFLRDQIVVLDTSSSEFLEPVQINLLVIDSSNPTMDYRYPLATYNLEKLAAPFLRCDPEKNLIILRGVDQENKRVTVFLNGNFEVAERRVIQVVQDKVGNECSLRNSMNYIVEYCMTANSSSHFPLSLRFNRILQPRVILIHSDSTVSDNYLNISNQKVSHLVNFKIDSLKPICSMEAGIHKQFSDSIEKEHFDQSKIKVYNFTKEVLNFDCHLLDVQLKTASGKRFQPVVDGSSSAGLLPRLTQLVSYRRSNQDIEKPSAKIPGLDRMIHKGRFLGTLTAINKLHQISTWFTLSETDWDQLDQSKMLKGVFSFPTKDVCEEMDFIIEKVDGVRTVFVGLVCSEPNRFNILLFQYLLEEKDYPTLLLNITKGSDIHKRTNIALGFQSFEGNDLIAINVNADDTSAFFVYDIKSKKDYCYKEFGPFITASSLNSYFFPGELDYFSVALVGKQIRVNTNPYSKESWLLFPSRFDQLETDNEDFNQVNKHEGNCNRDNEGKVFCAVMVENLFIYTFEIVDNIGDFSIASITKHFLPVGIKSQTYFLIEGFLVVDGLLINLGNLV